MLKEKYEGISKNWKISSSHEPIFSGGKIEISVSEDLLISSFQNNLTIVDWNEGNYLSRLFEDSDGDQEDFQIITCFAINPVRTDENETLISTATKNGLLMLFNLSSKECLKTIKAHLMPILAMAYDPSGTLVATGSADKSIKIFDIIQGHCTHIFKEHTDIIQRLYFHPIEDILQLFSSSDDHTIRMYDLRESCCVAVFNQHMSLPTGMAVSDNGYILGSCGRDKVINFYELRQRVLIKTVLVMDVLESIVFMSADQSKAFLARHNSMLALRTLSSSSRKGGKGKGATNQDAVPASGVQQYVVVSAGELGLLYVHTISLLGKDVSTFICQNMYRVPVNPFPPEILVDSNIKAFSFIRNGQFMSKCISARRKNNDNDGEKARDRVGFKANNVKSRDDDVYASHIVLLPPSTPITHLQYLPKSGKIVAVMMDHNILTFDINCIENVEVSSTDSSCPLRISRQIVGFNDDILDMKFLPVPLPLSSWCGDLRERVETHHDAVVGDATKAIERHALAVITNSPQVRLFDDHFRSTTLQGHTDIVLAVDTSPDGQWIASCSKDSTVRLWNIETLRCHGICRGHTDAVGAVAMSKNQQNYFNKTNYLVSGGSDKILKKWDISFKNLSEFGARLSSEGFVDLSNLYEESNRSNFNSVISYINEVTQSNYYPSTSSNSLDYRLYSNFLPRIILNIPILKSIKAHEKDITSVAVSPNDTLIATGSQDKTIKLWQADKLFLVATLSGHKRSVWKVNFSPIDKVLVSSSGDRTLRLWSMNDYSCLRTFEGHTASVLSVQFVNRGLQLLSTSADGLVRLWTIRSGECENTFDQHQDKIWSLTTPPDSFYLSNSKSNSSPALQEIQTIVEEGMSPMYTDANGDLSEGGDDDHISSILSSRWDNITQIFFTGGSDSRILRWEDTTKDEENEALRAREEELVLEQEMHNDLRNKRFGKALKVALCLGHSNRTLTILKAILDEENQRLEENPTLIPTVPFSACAFDSNSFFGQIMTKTTEIVSAKPAYLPQPSVAALCAESNSLDKYVSPWSNDILEQIIGYIREWNTNAKNSRLCMMALDSILRIHGFNKLKTLPKLLECLPGLVSYSERHFQRINKLHEASYLSEYIVSLITHFPTQVSPMLSTESIKSSSANHIYYFQDQSGKKKSVKMLTDVDFSVRKKPTIFCDSVESELPIAIDGLTGDLDVENGNRNVNSGMERSKSKNSSRTRKSVKHS